MPSFIAYEPIKSDEAEQQFVAVFNIVSTENVAWTTAYFAGAREAGYKYYIIYPLEYKNARGMDKEKEFEKARKLMERKLGGSIDWEVFPDARNYKDILDKVKTLYEEKKKKKHVRSALMVFARKVRRAAGHFVESTTPIPKSGKQL